MADYYPLIARAIAGLDPSAPGESRRALYERARAALIAQLRSVEPPLSEAELTRERLSLEEAVRKVEDEVHKQTVRPWVPGLGPNRFNPRRGTVFTVPTGPTGPGDLSPALRQIDDAVRFMWSHHDLKAVNLVVGTFPPISAIPAQDEKGAIAFRASARGPLELLEDPAGDTVDDPEQSQLYLRLRQQLRKLKDEIPGQERQQIEAVLDDFLDQPATWQEVHFKKVLWLSGNALRNTLAQHDAVKSNPDPHYSKLPPSVAEALRRPVETWNVFALGDSKLAELDAKRLGPQEHQAIVDNINAARPIIEAAALNREITTEQAGKVVTATLRAASVSADNINTRQAQSLAAGTSGNLIFQIVRSAYLFCCDLVDPRTEEARALVAEYRKGAAKAAGASTFTAIAASAVYGAPYAASFVDFVVHNGPALKEYFAVALQNDLNQVIDAVQSARSSLIKKRATINGNFSSRLRRGCRPAHQAKLAHARYHPFITIPSRSVPAVRRVRQRPAPTC
jgi:hypothetical protein